MKVIDIGEVVVTLRNDNAESLTLRKTSNDSATLEFEDAKERRVKIQFDDILDLEAFRDGASKIIDSCKESSRKSPHGEKNQEAKKEDA